jgi:hypothetical protein
MLSFSSISFLIYSSFVHAFEDSERNPFPLVLTSPDYEKLEHKCLLSSVDYSLVENGACDGPI